jgi:BlaI family penicillinase repressor
VTREKVSRSRLKALLEELYDGAAAPLVLQLVRERRLSRRDIAELQRLIEELDVKSRRGKSKPSRRSGS